MTKPTSVSLALVVLVLLPFNIFSWVLRFYVRLSRKAWGPDDWSMVVAIPLFTISTIGMLGIAYTGGGKRDDELTPDERERAMFWWFVMQTMFCLAAIPVKWAICFTLLRIAEGRRVYEITIYIIMAAVAGVMASTTIYEFFHCTPLQMNWKPVEGGSCKAQSNITGFSFALSAVSIASDWFCALIPIPLLWSIQIHFRVKLSILALLGLGIIASTAAIVRLTVTLNLSSTKDFLYRSMPVAAWAHAELGLGVVLANLSVLRPLFEKLFHLRETIRSGGKCSKGISNDVRSGDDYVELDERCPSKRRSKFSASNKEKGPESRILDAALDRCGSNSTDEFGANRLTAGRDYGLSIGSIIVDREFRVTHQKERN